ncbi:MAG: Holliday junction branch migration protein RuvA [Waddliaceae bacterium]
MFEYLKGTLVSKSDEKVIIDVGGIGYLIYVPKSLYDQLKGVSNEVLLYTSFVVREDSHTLYGFFTSNERDFFEKMTTISGVGPKLALAILGNIPLNTLFQVVHGGDVNALTQIPGVGKKKAERLLIELRDKVGSSSITASFAFTPPLHDAIQALQNLGYSKKSSTEAVENARQSVSDLNDVSLLVTTALKTIH